MPNLTKLKFKENGDFAYFPGNTVVANLYHQEKLIKYINIIQDEYRKLPFYNKFTLTPNKSIHMTVIELLCDKNRLPEYWSKDIPLDMPIDEVSDYFGKKLDIFPLLNEDIEMEVIGMGVQNILVKPANEKSLNRLKEIRNYVSKNAGVDFPNSDTYQFHISIGYLRIPLNEEEQLLFDNHKNKITKLLNENLKIIKINRIDYTTFKDMTQFIPYEK
ncbi:MAG: DUF1868 domain-containing protein [Erysipelotrichaceae bacterium]|jgi:hypothetical protein|nr:DUF1868 domain-containing protein [Bacillota bacterium]